MKNYMPKLIFTLMLPAFMFMLPGLTSVHGQSPGKPNVIIIFIDDMGYGDLSCYGNKQVTTTNIDALAKRGTKFTRFYS
ncbi:MAG: arylsulfatase, partial [Chitinophagaceae bacterium]